MSISLPFLFSGRLSGMHGFADIKEKLAQNEIQWKHFVMQAQSADVNMLAEMYQSDLTSLQRIMLFHCFHPTKLRFNLCSFISEVLGCEFIKSPAFDLSRAFAESTCCRPLIFISTPSYDPMRNIRQLADSQLIDRNRLKSLSLGEQQTSLATKLIEDGIKSGDWVILQNCHLAIEWMGALERICYNLAPDTTNPDFRLWLTTNGAPLIPTSLSQRCVKLINEPPQQFREILAQTFSSHPLTNENWLAEHKHQNNLKSLLFSVSLFHGLTLQRRHFDSIGWNHPYAFSDTDLNLSIHQFYDYSNAFISIQFATLQTILAECVYGGHLNDICDVRCLESLTKCLFTRESIDRAKLIDSTLNIEKYFPPSYSTVASIAEHINKFDDKTDATICGFHANLNVVKERNESNFLVANVVLAQVSIQYCYQKLNILLIRLDFVFDFSE